ncbi:MAG: phosphoenolpyruvate synthase [Anaerolineae bacterium]|nr:phosphoenolpyruvate synthase [Anaerolineae bacterium]
MDSQATLGTVGGKGASLARLAGSGLPVPDGFHVTTAAYRRFVAHNDLQEHIAAALHAADPQRPVTLEQASAAIREAFDRADVPADVAGAVAQAYGRMAGEAPHVAVRSSATAEDLPDFSFAGQQETYLNVQGAGEVVTAVKRCWSSLWTARAIGYRIRNAIDQDVISLAVVVQHLVPAEAAGIMFTANPVTGARDQATINAAWGLGEAVVGGAVTPDTLVVEKETGRILTRETAHKETMTVRVAGGTQEQPVPAQMRDAPVLDDALTAELTRLGMQIEQLYGQPMDIEWALADGMVTILQARPITALPEPEPSPPTDWPLPDPKGKYMRSSIVDLMPDPLTPLFATFGIQTINASIHRLIAWIGKAEASVMEEILATINGYAYLIGSYTPREWGWMLTKMLPGFRRILTEGIPFWRDEKRPAYLAATQHWEARPVDALSPIELWHGVQDIATAAADHLGSLMVGTMGASAGSEALFTNVYEKLIRQEGDPPATAFLMGYNTTPIQAEKSLYDLSAWCSEQPQLPHYISNTPTRQVIAALGSSQPPAGLEAGVWQEFHRRFQTHLKQFGHIVYDLDFGKPLPLDDPTPMVEACKMYLRGGGSNPHTRQETAAQRRKQAVETMHARLKRLRLWAFRKTLGWAQRQAEVREDGISDIGLGYPQLREMLRELGRRFVRAGALEQADDVFWLVGDELERSVAALERGDGIERLVERVRERQAVWRAEKRVTPPPMLPPSKTYMGFNIEAFMAADADDQVGSIIKGVAASPGRVTAPARVLHGPEDFGQMESGDVLVAGITTPAWTPLFAMAAGVVTDIGGPLSHGSIVAREYGIPAVLGTGVATRRIRSGQVVTVDGSAGTVTMDGGAAEM